MLRIDSSRCIPADNRLTVIRDAAYEKDKMLSFCNTLGASMGVLGIAKRNATLDGSRTVPIS